MQTEPTVQFFDDEDDTLYVEFEGTLEVKMTDSEVNEWLEQLKLMDGDHQEKALTALILEMGFAYIHEITPVLRKALMEQYDIEMEEDAVLRIDQEVQEILHGFMKMLGDQEVEDEEG